MNDPSQWSFELRKMRATDWELAKCVRLAALADAPDAFASTLAEELAFADERWRERAASNAEGITTIGFFAQREDIPCGMVVGVRSPDASHVTLNALWVAQNVRRRGVARALIEAVCSWARELGAQRVELEVTEVSKPAIAAYRALGFEVLEGARGECGARRAPALHMQRYV
jgi:GNAT superfamily N-acetyltransferase